MIKFKSKIRNDRLEIKNKLGKDEELNNRELEILANNNIRGLMAVRIVSPRKMTFYCPEAMPLRNYLGGGLTREDFALVIAQIVRIAQKIAEFTLQLSNLELSADNVYIVRNTRELMFIYRPVISAGAVCDINGFMNSIIRCTSFSAQQDTKYVGELETVLRKMEKFPSKMMSDYVRHLDPQIFDMVLSDETKKTPRAASEDLTDVMDDDATGLLDESGEELTGLLNEDDLPTGLLNEDDDATGILNEDDLAAEAVHGDDFAEKESGNEAAGHSLLFGNDDGGDLYGFYGRTFGNSVSQQNDELPTGLLDDDELPTGLLSDDDLPTGLLSDDDLPTGLLDDDEPWSGSNGKSSGNDVTTLHREARPLPWLERCSKGERRRIDKPLFRIGKDKYHVDYFVDGNPAVSRNHACILSKNGRYFIVDNNSLNHSFVDGMIVPIQKEYEIFDGCAVCLANEEFIFHTK